jgi:gluconate 5-dehydrogenase
MSVADYQKVLDVHLVGAFALTKALVPHMKAQKLGSIIFMASMTSYIGQPAVAGYSTAKAGILGLVHTLATECGPENVRINAVAPGWIDTPMFHKATDNDPPRLNKILGRIPMNRVGDPMDIGMAVSFLSSEAARYINGICLPVDGGALIGF